MEREGESEMLQPLVLVVDHLQMDVRTAERGRERVIESDRERMRE